MNTLYRISNYGIGIVSTVVLGYLAYGFATTAYAKCDEAFPAMVAAFGLVGVLVIGFLLLDQRKM